jgi:hypothetical protein
MVRAYLEGRKVQQQFSRTHRAINFSQEFLTAGCALENSSTFTILSIQATTKYFKRFGNAVNPS